MKLSPPTRVSDAAVSGQPAVRRPISLAPRHGLLAALWRKRRYLLCAVLPTLLTALYLYGFAAGQFAAEGRFLVRGKQGGQTSSLGDMLGAAGFKTTPEDALTVRDYLQSHDALRELVKNVGLIELYRRPEADVVNRLWSDDLPIEMLQLYHNSMSTLTIDTTSGITTLKARAFRPEDAKLIADEQLRMAENFVNQLSGRAREETLRVARTELQRAEQRVIDSQAAVTSWREREQAVDPSKTAAIGLESLGALEALLTQARAELQERTSYMRPDNPMMASLRNRIASLQTEIVQQRRRLTLGGQALPAQLATYERLLLEREFADKQLGSATASLETARLDAQRQQLFLARVVEPGIAEYAMYPRAWIIVLSVFVLLSLFYGIGWMLVSGMREHAF